MKNLETEEVMHEILKSHNVTSIISEIMTTFSQSIDHKLERDEKCRVLELCMGYLIHRTKLWDDIDQLEKNVIGIKDGTILTDSADPEFLNRMLSRIENFKGQAYCLLKLMYEYVGFPFQNTTQYIKETK